MNRKLPAGRLEGTVRIPGSKSYTNRALVAAALAGRPWVLQDPLDSDDTRTLAGALARMGASVVFSGRRWEIAGPLAVPPSRDPLVLDIGPAGTPARFLLALCSALPGEFVLDGSKRMRERPMGDLVFALRQLGAEIESAEKEGFLPLKIHGRKLRGGHVAIDGSVSSQFISALLLIQCLLESPLTLEVRGQAVSGAYVDMTRETLEEFSRESGHYEVPGDDSGACFFIAGAAISSGSIRLEGLRKESIQPDAVFRSWAREAGAVVSWEDGLVVGGPPSSGLRPLRVSVDGAPDAALPLAALLAFADGTSRLEGARRLREKESDRLAAARDLLSRAATASEEGADGGFLVIEGRSEPRARASFDAHDDHRVAMSAAVLALRCSEGGELSGAESVSKSFPEFWKLWESVVVPHPAARREDLQA